MVMEIIGGLIGLVIWVCIYFLPTIIANSPTHEGKIHKNATAVFVVNFFLGWTIIGWVIALVMAVWNRE